MYDPALSRLIEQAVSRLQSEMMQSAPFMAGPVSGWIRQLAGTEQPVDYFKHPLAFPALLLPWWLEKNCGHSHDLSLQSDLVYSTINGYFFIRLIDNLMDDQATIESSLLPALGFFHTQFQMAYYGYFSADHAFWEFFRATWFQSGEAAMQDASLSEIDADRFRQISARKVCAAKIPLAAVCYRYDRPNLIEPWSRLVDLLGCWHQLFNDLFDWHRDHERQIRTYFLSEAERRRRPEEPVAGWVAREGFQWATEQLQTWMVKLKAVADELHSPDLAAYVRQREAALLKQKEEIEPGLKALEKLVGPRQVLTRQDS